VEISGESDGTENPIRRWTGVHFFTEPGDDGLDMGDLGKSEMWKESGQGFGSPGMKSTRHLPPQSKHSDNLNRNFFNYRSPTSATIQVCFIHILFTIAHIMLRYFYEFPQPTTSHIIISLAGETKNVSYESLHSFSLLFLVSRFVVISEIHAKVLRIVSQDTACVSAVGVFVEKATTKIETEFSVIRYVSIILQFYIHHGA